MNNENIDVLIVGTGAAGLSLALQLPENLNILLLCKNTLNEGSTYYAQGGIAAVQQAQDSLESHVADTLRAGCGLCDPAVVEHVVAQAPHCVQWLIDLGVAFTQVDAAGGYHLHQEGGHSHRRIFHADDATGKALSTTLTQQVKQRRNIQVLENHMAVDIVQNDSLCQGAYVYDMLNDKVRAIPARAVVLATGGASRVYLYSSNPDVSSGDGIAIAARAGCRTRHMEFNQFHPTCLYHPEARTLLLTEAIRGEGGILTLPNGERFMQRYDARGELAPRDVVARAIDAEMKRAGVDCVYLDISHKPYQFIKSHFPNLYDQCLQYGFDMAKQALPVVPAAHYTCGGVQTDLHGQTDLPGLYAIGETASTGLHGANRMASNSLLECLVFAQSCAKHIQDTVNNRNNHLAVCPWDDSQVIHSDEAVVITHNWNELRHFMWDYVGIVRSDKRLQRAQARINLLKQEVLDYYAQYRVSRDFLELRNLVIVADLIVQQAIARKDNIGLHYNLDLCEASSSASHSANALSTA